MIKKIAKWYYGAASIRKKLVISYMFLVLFPVIVLGTYSYHMAKSDLLRQTKVTLESNVSSIAYSLGNNIKRESDNIKYLSYNVRFREKLAAGSKSPSSLAKELNDSVEPVFWYFITSDNNIKGIQIYSAQIESPIGSFLKPAQESANADWYQSHENNFATQWRIEGDKIFASRALLDAASSSRMIGIMRLEVYPDVLTEPVFQSRFLENGVLLMDSAGQTVGHRPIEDASLDDTILTAISSGSLEEYTETGQYIISSKVLPENGWKVFYYIDKREISSQVNTILRTTLFIVGICLAVITLLISILSKILSSRILRLKECAEQVGTGNFEDIPDTSDTDEIGIVTNSFHTMSRKINEMMKEVYQMGLEKRATELKALQAMINPHFLYNCLSSIKWKAIRSGQDDIGEITGHLAKFYRTVLNDGNQITIVKNELENIRSYLELQSRTHENSFSVIYDISRQEQNCEMPNFLLQPIVENAIFHGTENLEDHIQGLIKVIFFAEDDFLIFQICNNGPPIGNQQLHEILSSPGKGYGIFNIQERIRMYYDEACGISGSLTEDGLICFTVRIRKQIENKF